MESFIRVEQLKTGDIFQFPFMEGVNFRFIAFKWREDIIVFTPITAVQEFYTELYDYSQVIKIEK